MKLSDINLKIISDSRGEDTIEVEVAAENLKASASVPVGKSKGAHEACATEAKDALGKLEFSKSDILRKEFEDQKGFDSFLISLDGREDKSNLGANLILALSLSWARLKTKSHGIELFQYIRELNDFRKLKIQIDTEEIKIGRKQDDHRKFIPFPRPFFNVINGGAHAKNNLDFQEFQVIPVISDLRGYNDFEISLNIGKEFYKKLKDVLEKKFGKENVLLGDEAGFSAPFKNNEEALRILRDIIVKNDYPLKVGLDMAANQYFKEKFYFIEGKKYLAAELLDFYSEIIRKYEIFSIEDPFSEESFEDFAKLKRRLQKKTKASPDHFTPFIITDDLTTTNPNRLRQAIKEKSGDAIIIKPNQIGTLSEVIETAQIAKLAGWKTIVSHRSGETMDDFIADLAVGINAFGIKAGAPAKPERMAKYERLLVISKQQI
ncbi:phosphopyruvate hydratase [Candidatus Wolfebacteria bacterium]|nr:phosphopyruvate hydratase [Candidatus Wolfebacteria bacterium]